MKLYLRNQEEFYPDTIEFYEKHFDIVYTKDAADIIVLNNFRGIKTNKIVACNSTGIDHIKAPKVISLRGEDLSDLTAVPELCLAMAIYTMRLFKNQEVKGKRLGIIGYGRIGKKFEEYALNMGMGVLRYDKYKKIGKLDDVLKRSDVISIHVSSDYKNRSLIRRKHFDKMKDGVILLNSARPWIVEWASLKSALEDKLAGAWFDFELTITHPNLITTSHLGGTTEESKQISEMLIAKKLLKLYADKR